MNTMGYRRYWLMYSNPSNNFGWVSHSSFNDYESSTEICIEMCKSHPELDWYVWDDTTGEEIFRP